WWGGVSAATRRYSAAARLNVGVSPVSWYVASNRHARAWSWLASSFTAASLFPRTGARTGWRSARSPQTRRTHQKHWTTARGLRQDRRVDDLSPVQRRTADLCTSLEADRTLRAELEQGGFPAERWAALGAAVRTGTSDEVTVLLDALEEA